MDVVSDRILSAPLVASGGTDSIDHAILRLLSSIRSIPGQIDIVLEVEYLRKRIEMLWLSLKNQKADGLPKLDRRAPVGVIRFVTVGNGRNIATLRFGSECKGRLDEDISSLVLELRNPHSG